MRHISFIFCLFIFSSLSLAAQNAAGGVKPTTENSNVDTISLPQLDGSTITILGIGSVPLAYTESIDGYTLVLNKIGIYEYAELSKKGDLEPSGIKANNPAKRDAKELKYINKLTKHLRYQGAKLEEIQAKHNKLNTTPKKEKK